MITKLDTMELQVRPATKTDLPHLRELLTIYNLPVVDLEEENINFLLALSEGEIVGSIGIEEHGLAGLLRSLAVRDTFRNRGIADLLVKNLLETSASKGLEEMYLLTTTAEKYFLKHGFRAIARETVPEGIRSSREFKSICPASAVVMMRVVA